MSSDASAVANSLGMNDAERFRGAAAAVGSCAFAPPCSTNAASGLDEEGDQAFACGGRRMLLSKRSSERTEVEAWRSGGQGREGK